MRSILFILACAVAETAASATWSWLHPLPQGNMLAKVSFANARWGYAVGDDGTILATHDGGRSWIVQYEAITDDLRDVVCVDSLSAWIVGDNGMLLHTTDGGFHWLEQPPVTAQGLNAVHFADGLHGWLGGDGKTILRTTDGGASWKAASLPPGLNGAGINALAFPTPAEGWATGYSTSSGGVLWHSTNAGQDWSLHSILPASGFRVVFSDPSTGYIVGGAGMFNVTTNGGATWSYQTASGYGLNDLLVSGRELWAAGDNATILHSTNGGTSWSEEPRSMYASLNGITFAGTTPVAVGEYGAIVRREGTWTFQDPAEIRSVNWLAFTDRRNGIAAGQYGLLIKTSDGGATWVTVAGISGDSYYGAEMTDASNAWVAGDLGILLHTSDGGSHWAQQSTSTTRTLLSISFVDAARGWAAGDAGELIRTSDGGEHWVRITSGVSSVLYGVKFLDPLRGWAVGAGGTILRTTDGGNSWTGQASGTAATLYAVDFIDRQHGFAPGNGGIVVRTTDAGSTWAPVSSGQTRTLYRVSGNDPAHVIAVGDSGTVLRSVDAGITWQTEFAATTYDLYSVVTFGDSVSMTCGDVGTILRTTPGIPTATHDEAREGIPVRSALEQNYPNPFNGISNFEFRISEWGWVRVTVHDLLGREVATLVDERRAPGRYTIRFDAGNLASGMYLYRLTTGSESFTRRMLLIR